MTDVRAIAFIQFAGTIPVAAGAFFAAYFSYKSIEIARKTLEVSKKTEINTNSLAQQLVATTKAASHAEGVLEGKSGVEPKNDPKNDPGPVVVVGTNVQVVSPTPAEPEK